MTIYPEGRKGGAFLPNVFMVRLFLAVLFHEAPASPTPRENLHDYHSERPRDGPPC